MTATPLLHGAAADAVRERAVRRLVDVLPAEIVARLTAVLREAAANGDERRAVAATAFVVEMVIEVLGRVRPGGDHRGVALTIATILLRRLAAEKAVTGALPANNP